MKHAGKNNIKNVNSLTLGDEKTRSDTGQKINSNHHIGSNPAQVSQHKYSMRFVVLTEVKIPVLVLWIVTPCGLAGRYHTSVNPEDGGSMHYAKFVSTVSYLYLNTKFCLRMLVCGLDTLAANT
jgi:hypothetical protein